MYIRKIGNTEFNYANLINLPLMRKMGLRDDKKEPLFMVIKSPHTKTIEARFSFKLNSKDSSMGLIHLLEHSLFSNVYQGLSFEDASALLQEKGIYLNAYTSNRELEIVISTGLCCDNKYGKYSESFNHINYIDLIFEIFATMVRDVCTKEYFEQEKQIVINEFKENLATDINGIESFKIKSIVNTNNMSILGNSIDKLKKATYKDICLLFEAGISMHGFKGLTFYVPEFVDTNILYEKSLGLVESLSVKTFPWGKYTLLNKMSYSLIDDMLRPITLNSDFIENNYKKLKNHDNYYLEYFGSENPIPNQLIIQFPISHHNSFIKGFRILQDGVILWNLLYRFIRQNCLAYSLNMSKADIYGSSVTSFIVPLNTDIELLEITEFMNKFLDILKNDDMVNDFIISNGKEIIRDCISIHEGVIEDITQNRIIREFKSNTLTAVEFTKLLDKIGPKEDEVISSNILNYCECDEKSLKYIREKLVHVFSNSKKVIFYNKING